MEILTDYILIALLPLGIISVGLYIPTYLQAKRIRKIEEALAEVLSDLTEYLKGGYSLESALKEVAEKRRDPLGKELQILMKDLGDHTLKEALIRFGKRSNSRAVMRVTSILNIALETNANLADVVKRVSEDLWTGYILERERESKVSSYSFLTLLTASLLIPGIIGFIFGAFGPAFATKNPEKLNALITDFKGFVIALGICGAAMSGCITGKLKKTIVLAPFYALISYGVFIASVQLISKFIGGGG